jgi:cell wall-associated NlpC family hydrolase
MKLKFAAISALALTLTTGCVTPESSEALKVTTVTNKVNTLGTLNPQTMAAKHRQALDNLIVIENTKRMQKALNMLKSHIGKTWYVFSGATPQGWDCSGLTMWFYQQLNIDIEHRASKQEASGEIVRSPKIGDIVIFKYKGRSDAYHVGIYSGNGNMIHAPKHGHVTRSESISTFGGNYSDITYIRLLETL